MEKRGILLAFFVAVLGLGGTAMIGTTTLQNGSPYFEVLMYGGMAAVVASLIGIIWLARTSSRPDSQKPEEPEESDVPDIRISQIGDAQISNVTSNTGRRFLDADQVDKMSLKGISLGKATDDKKGKKGGR
tara:strand:+ start:100 stop:492 length:393 start_codon:yes stop_codon:yes gene_type:complete